MTAEYEGAGTAEERLDKLERKVYAELWIWRVFAACSAILVVGTWLVCYYVLWHRGVIP